MEDKEGTAAASPRLRRWPMALLVGFITALVAAAICAPVADWATQEFHVSNMEGGRGMLIACIWIPLAAIIGFVVGFAVSFFIKRTGFAGYAARQGLALLVVLALTGVAAGITYLGVDHPPLLDDKTLALDIQVRLPAKGRTVEELQAQNFDLALVVSASDRSYSDMRWSEATVSDGCIIVPAWAKMNSRNAGREITAGVRDENRQIFNVMLSASPKKIDDAWSEWAPPRERFNGSKPTPEDQYQVRYRVRFEEEYSPTPPPQPVYSPVPEESPTPEKSPTPEASVAE